MKWIKKLFFGNAKASPSDDDRISNFSVDEEGNISAIVTLSVNGEKTVLASQSAQRKHDTSPAHSNFPRNRPPPLPPAEQSCEHSAARFSFPSLRIQNSLSRNRLLQDFFTSPGFRLSLHKKKRKKERLEHSALDTVTSFSCRACHVSDDVSLYKGNPSFRPCPRCGQSGWGCLLSNIRLPE